MVVLEGVSTQQCDVEEMPECNFHLLYGHVIPAVYFGPTTEGVPAYMCQGCYEMFGLEDVTRLGGTLLE